MNYPNLDILLLKSWISSAISIKPCCIVLRVVIIKAWILYWGLVKSFLSSINLLVSEKFFSNLLFKSFWSPFWVIKMMFYRYYNKIL